ncbi:alpha/beta fold hydrolase [uncultured Microbacterium sp.]|uniref:alpha/beta fold hydrolase n=1 Tax=uncultured Microbacterium sp. TaxID=191216 RepID=UPI0026146D74|nr:alpha/beta hydrolase [uncultured Microbacterium sp.]
MPAPVTLPTLSWGSPHARQHALLIHGLGSNGALMWRYGVALADAGWLAQAVDLRGHGLAPRALDYSIAAYAADVVHTGAPDGEPWDLVIGHSLGGAAATLASADVPAWTRRLVLIDPGLHLSDRDRQVVRRSQARAFADPTEDAVRAEHPEWHPHDIELKALSARQASRWAVEQTSIQNTPWDVRAAAARLTVPTHIIASDPTVYSIFTGAVADDVRQNPVVTMSVVAGAGHSPHRDKPEDTLAHLHAALR